MLKDISVGQYLPGKTFIYKLDPRTKILTTIFFVGALLGTDSGYAYALVVLWLGAALAGARIKPSLVFRGLKGLLGLICFSAAAALCLTPGTLLFQWGWLTVTHEGLVLGGEIVVRFVMLIAGSSLLTYTTSQLELLDGLSSLLGFFRRFGLPAHELAMMMSIALRFVPIMTEEARIIMKAQAARGADFTNGSLLQRGKAMVPLVVPLLVSVWRRTEDLSVAMDARCYNGEEGRSSWRTLRMRGKDFAVLTGAALLCVLVFVL